MRNLKPLTGEQVALFASDNLVTEISRPTFGSRVSRALMRVASRLALLALIFPIAAFAQYSRYRFEHWTTDRGLPQNTVRNIVQTRDGYLWMTTYDVAELVDPHINVVAKIRKSALVQLNKESK